MFNRSPYNGLKFNQPNDHKTLSAELSADSNVRADNQTILTTQAKLSAKSGLRQLTYMSARLSAAGSVQANPSLMMKGRAALSAEAGLIARASKWQRKTITFSGVWAPGDVIYINHRTLSFLVNGQNALEFMQGEFGSYSFGLNEIAYADSAAVRHVLAQIVYKQTDL
jgi:hypothetical protein